MQTINVKNNEGIIAEDTYEEECTRANTTEVSRMIRESRRNNESQIPTAWCRTGERGSVSSVMVNGSSIVSSRIQQSSVSLATKEYVDEHLATKWDKQDALNRIAYLQDQISQLDQTVSNLMELVNTHITGHMEHT